MKKKKVSRKKKEHFNFREEYTKCWDFLKASREFLYFIILVFFIFFVLGFFFTDLIDSLFRVVFNVSLSETILDYINQLILQTEGMGMEELIGFIFLNNLRSSFFALVFGILLGIFPVFAAVLNGFLLGFVADLSVRSQGIFVLWRILPHGIFELPAVFISLGLGLRLGFYFWRRRKNEKFKDLFIESIRIFLLIVFPLLVIAAIIEGILIAFF